MSSFIIFFFYWAPAFRIILENVNHKNVTWGKLYYLEQFKFSYWKGSSARADFKWFWKKKEKLPNYIWHLVPFYFRYLFWVPFLAVMSGVLGRFTSPTYSTVSSLPAQGRIHVKVAQSHQEYVTLQFKRNWPARKNRALDTRRGSPPPFLYV